MGFTGNGIEIIPSAATTTEVTVLDTVVTNNAGGILTHNSGAGTVKVSLLRVQASGNSAFGVKADGTSGSGPIFVALTDSESSNNNNGLNVLSGPGSATVMVNRSALVNNNLNGMQSNQSAGGTAKILVGFSTITGNNVAALSVGGGAVLTYGNNQVNGNISSDGTFTGPAIGRHYQNR
jgi:hypothetical protein